MLGKTRPNALFPLHMDMSEKMKLDLHVTTLEMPDLQFIVEPSKRCTTLYEIQ